MSLNNTIEIVLISYWVKRRFKRIGYNTNQSEIAIGSGGWLGRGFLEGTQTKGGFVPEQHTDYIFTVGEEWGFVGSSSHHYLLPYFLESSI
jgi:cell division protein FtsW (lipid II flippase)